MNKNVIIIGASGHGKVIADIIKCSGDNVFGFLDDNEALAGTTSGAPLLGKIEIYTQYNDIEFIVAIGGSAIREKIVAKMVNVQWYTAIHPTAVISKLDTVIGEGTAIMANAVINPGTTIGKHCIINTGAVVDHDNSIGDYSHISVGAKLAGTVEIGKHTWIGVGAAVSNNISICDGCLVGAGAVVVKDIKENGTYVGIPARKIK
jgi:sugar O-acyltransferase, sialic acid O-acetyltransferase NeuD family